MADSDDFFAKRVVYQVAGMDRVQVRRDLVYKTNPELRFDLYHPESATSHARIPVVVLVHGDSSPEILANAKNWGMFESLGELIAASGLAAVAFNHRSTELRTKLREATPDVDDLVDYLRERHDELQVDPERLALWVFSMGPPVGLSTALRERPDFIRCIVVYYGIMSLTALREETPPEVSDEVLGEYSPLELLLRSNGPFPPMLIARSGLEERPWLNPTIDRFVAEALRRNVAIDVLNHRSGHHAFEVVAAKAFHLMESRDQCRHNDGIGFRCARRLGLAGPESTSRIPRSALSAPGDGQVCCCAGRFAPEQP